MQHLLQHYLQYFLRELLQLTPLSPRSVPVVRRENRRGVTPVERRRSRPGSPPFDFLFSSLVRRVTMKGMRNFMRPSLCYLACLTLTAAVQTLGCESAAEREVGKPKSQAGERGQVGEAKKVAMGKNVYLEVLPDKKRRVLVNAEVCLREGQLELFLCRRQTKEHEAILTADVDARKIHAALIAAGAVEGSPVRFVPNYRPASGTKIEITLQYEAKDKKPITVSAKSWIKDAKKKAILESDWVFAGSHLVANPLDPDGPKHYLANDGDVICVSNFETALLDLPIKSPKDDADRIFVANTERIPPVETKVVVILTPIVEAKKEKK